MVSRSGAGDDLFALLADEIEQTVVVRRYSNGSDLLMTSFETLRRGPPLGGLLRRRRVAAEARVAGRR